MSTSAGAIFLAGRILFAALFAFSARGHVTNHRLMVTAARRARLPFPDVAGWPIGVWLVLGDISVVFGIWPDIGSLMLAAFLVPTTLYFHRFWSVAHAAEKRTQQSSLYRNVSLLGACLVVFASCATLGASLRFAITAPALTLG